jgi:protein transport protein SEC61 subunit alpha
VFAVVIAIVQAVLLVLSGLYGNPSEIGTLGCALLVGQVVIASIITMLLDELLQKGYGLGSGINIFVASSITQSIFWKILSLSTIATIRGNEYEGSLIALVHLIASRRDKTRALKDAFYRTDLPNFMNTIAAIAAFAAAVYLQGFRVELPVKSNRLRGQSNSYPIKLLYTASMPIMLLTALISNILLVSQALYIQFGDNVLVRALGVWEPLTESNQLFVTSGAAYFLTAPRGLVDAITHPLHTAVYATIVIIACAYLSKLWMEISGSSTRDVSKQLRDQQLSIAGYRDSSIYKELNRVIPSAATFGGATLAIISVSADIFGAIGTGAGVLMSATIIFQYFELFVKEQMEGNMSMEQMMSGMQ